MFMSWKGRLIISVSREIVTEYIANLKAKCCFFNRLHNIRHILAQNNSFPTFLFRVHFTSLIQNSYIYHPQNFWTEGEQLIRPGQANVNGFSIILTDPNIIEDSNRHQIYKDQNFNTSYYCGPSWENAQSDIWETAR